jgi:hypothetical protein
MMLTEIRRSQVTLVSCRGVTKTPTPRTPWTMPIASSHRTALRTTVMDTPYRARSAAALGSRSPGPSCWPARDLFLIGAVDNFLGGKWA